MNHGEFVESISQTIGKRVVMIYIIISFYRRSLTAMAILALYDYPVAQVIICILITLIYLVYVMSYEVFYARNERTIEIINELVTLITLYILMCFTDQFVSKAETRLYIGFVLIGITGCNFLINLVPLLFKVIKDACRKIRRIIARRKHRLALQKRQKEHQHVRVPASSLTYDDSVLRDRAIN